MNLEPIQRARLIDSVTEELLGLIERGALQAGDKLPPTREIAERLGVSRATVREALQRLVMLGVLETRQGSGVFVRKISPDQLITPHVLLRLLESEALYGILEAREVLETALASLAAERATAEDLAKLDQLLAIEAELDEGDLEKGNVVNAAFHLAVAEAAHSPVLEKVYRSILDLLLLRQYRLSLMNSRRREAHEGHRRIVEAIRERDARRAREAVQEHMEYNRELVAELVGQGETLRLQSSR